MALPAVKQTNIVANRARNLIVFETEELCFNYKTGQWSVIPAYDGLGMYTVNDKDQDIGLVRYSAGSVDLQPQLTSYVAQDATITTGERDINQGGRTVVTGVRPLVTGADAKVSVITRDSQNPATRTNLVSYSEEISNAYWNGANVTITDNAIMAPDGETTADKMDADATATEVRQFARSNISHTSGAVLTLSGFFKSAAEVQYISLRLQDTTGSPTVAGQGFDLTNLTLAGTPASSSVPDRMGIQYAGNDWYRFWISATSVGSTSNITINMSSDSTGSASYAGTAGEGIYVWGVMLEEASYPTGYIQSVASAGTSTEHKTPLFPVNSRTGKAPPRAEGRYHKLQVKVSGGFTTIMGADVEFAPAGRT